MYHVDQITKTFEQWQLNETYNREQAFYYEGKAIMSNEEFDNLKEELMWEGSSVVMLS